MDEKRTGFTLIELVVTLSIAAILASMAAPSFSSFIKNNRLTTQINALSSAINLTRSEAVRRASMVTLCASSNGSSCTGAWEDGWIVFNDDDDDLAVDSNETILLVHAALPSDHTMNYKIGSVGSTKGITYEASGYANQASSFTLCDSRGYQFGKKLVLSKIGRPRLEDQSNILSCS